MFLQQTVCLWDISSIAKVQTCNMFTVFFLWTRRICSILVFWYWYFTCNSFLLTEILFFVEPGSQNTGCSTDIHWAHSSCWGISICTVCHCNCENQTGRFKVVNPLFAFLGCIVASFTWEFVWISSWWPQAYDVSMRENKWQGRFLSFPEDITFAINLGWQMRVQQISV